MVPPASCESPPLPSGRAARAKVRGAKLLAAQPPEAARRAGSTPRGAPASGVASVLLTVIRQMGGRRKVSLTIAREARLKGKRLTRKKGKTLGCPLLARSAAAQAAKMQL